jgi:hypothetical protein
MRFWSLAIAVTGLIATTAPVASAQPKFSHPNRVRYDGHCFTIDGKDLVLFSGAFHYFRCPKELWRERFRRIKEAGFNAIETYVAWNWSEPHKPRGLTDTSNVNLEDFDAFLTMAEDEFGLYTIVRPGPYICSEWESGGLPNWLPAFKPANPKYRVWYRSDDPVFEQWSHHWYDVVAKVVVKHQLTHKPVGAHGVILWQVENEYGGDQPGSDMKRNYVRDLIQRSEKDGIDVPIFTCWTNCVRDPKGDPILSQAFDNPNEYPRWNIAEAVSGIKDQHQAEPWAPKMITEFQGGWFGQVGGQAAVEQDGIDDRQINALTLWCIGNGLTGLNYYMLFGGTNFGDWAGQSITTSYDYAAPLREWGGVGAKYRAVKAIGQMLGEFGPDLARSDATKTEPVINGNLQQITRIGKSGSKYVFYWNSSRTETADVDPGDGKNLILPPFGANVFHYEKSPLDGSWIVKPDAAPKVSAYSSVRLKTAEVADLTPAYWRGAPASPSTLALGIYDSRFIAYKGQAPKGSYVWLKSPDSELICNQAPTGEAVQHGRIWAGTGAEQEFIALNPGWPNGGAGMEAPHGILEARTFSQLPVMNHLGGWKMKMLTDQSDRTLAAETVDTSDWTEGVHNDLFLPHTTGVLRTTFELATDPSPDAVFNCEGVDDEGWFYVNGKLIGEIHMYNEPVSFKVAGFLHKGANQIAIVIHNNEGEGGLTGPVHIEQTLPESKPTPLDWTDEFRAGQSALWALDPNVPISVNEHPKTDGPRPSDAAKLVRSTLKFDRPDSKLIWQILIEAGGDGFLTLNGHALGRYWESGPQRGFFLPQPWLKDHNTLELTVVPGRLGDRVKAAELRSLPEVE